MAVAISSADLVRAVSGYEIPGLGSGFCLGITSGTAAAHIVARRLQLGDQSIQRAFEALAGLVPSLEGELMALHRSYYVEGGKAEERPFKPVPRFDMSPPRSLVLLTLASNFAIVWECKQGHEGPVGINYLQKIELSQLPALYGAILADVDYVCAGAGDPSGFPGLLRRLACHEPVQKAVHVARASRHHKLAFDPRDFAPQGGLQLTCPRFIAIVSTYPQAAQLEANDATRPYGFVFEGPSAGGHNAPPAGYQRFKGEPPRWGLNDLPELDRLANLRGPFWLAGEYGNPEGLKRALAAGAAGVQFGTILAFSAESGMAPALRAAVLERIWRGELDVVTEPLMSPAGFPFKVAQVPGTISERSVRDERERWSCCDLGHLVTPLETRRHVVRADGTSEEIAELQMMCPAEPLEAFLRKGGLPLRRKDSICLCNALMSAAGYPAIRGGRYLEPPIVTMGDQSAKDVRAIQKHTRSMAYSARAALSYVLEGHGLSARLQDFTAKLEAGV
ncbi:MAG: nitronate monooxygenase [Deltaproteobacteria bacterium]|nr:nitronate monooxygenase [Deltaproteobacteria bacterium]